MRKKKCKACGETFEPVRQFQEVCKPIPCALDLAKIKRKKKEDREHRDRKNELKPMSHWLKITQDVFNEYIRLRDRNEPCISCGALDAPEWCAGHFRTRGAASHLRFDPNNVHKQCNRHCNMELSGNLANYRPRLIGKIGLGAVEALENDNRTAEWTREGLEQMRKEYRAKIKELEVSL